MRKKKCNYEEKITVRIPQEMYDDLFNISIKENKPLAKVFRNMARKGLYGDCKYTIRAEYLDSDGQLTDFADLCPETDDLDLLKGLLDTSWFYKQQQTNML